MDGMETTQLSSTEAARRLGNSPASLRHAQRHRLPLAGARAAAPRRARAWQLLALSPTPTVLMDAKTGMPLRANEAALRLYDLSRAEFIELAKGAAASLFGTLDEWVGRSGEGGRSAEDAPPAPEAPDWQGSGGTGGPRLRRQLGDRTILLERSLQQVTYGRRAAFLVTARDITAEVQFAALARASGALADTLDAERLYPIILEQAARVLPCDRAHVLLLKDGWAVVAAAWGTPLLERGSRRYSLDMPASGWYPETKGEAAYLADALLEPTFIHAPECSPEQRARSVIDVPLMAGETRLGFFRVISTTPNRYTPDHLRLARAFGERVTQAVRSAHLYAMERDPSRAAQDLAALHDGFVASVSHELRTPLTAILGYAELLEERWDLIDDRVRRERVHRIVGAANRQLQMVEELLLLSRIGAGKLEVQSLACPVAVLAQQATAELQGSYRQQQVLVSGGPGTMVLADGARAVQIIVNLLDNAAKYSPEGSPVRLTWREEGGMVAIRVQDRGRGVSEQGRERLFSRFGRLPGSQMRAGRVGTGLGLYLSRHLAEAMEGSLDLEASGSGGSTFRLRLPIVPM